jgi:hypothetical protein
METKIQPKQYFLFVDPDGGTAYKMIICLLDHNFNSNTAVNDASSMCGPDSAPGDITSTISLNGQMVLDPDSDEISAADIFDLQQAKTTIGWKIARGVPVAGDITKEGQGFFNAYTETHNKDNVSAFTGAISVKGAITQTIETGS